jgi:hypothetical protein
MASEMSINAYARYRNCRPFTVQMAIKRGRIRLNANGKIDPAEADQMWEENTNQRLNTRGKDSPHQQAPEALRARSRVEPRSPPERSSPGPRTAQSGAGGSTPTFSEARAVKEFYSARLTKLEYEKESGTLISANEVKVQTFNRFRAFRDQMLNIPDRIADELAGISDAHEIFRILTDEIKSALNDHAGETLSQ